MAMTYPQMAMTYSQAVAKMKLMQNPLKDWPLTKADVDAAVEMLVRTLQTSGPQ